jgi:hypothetical protein
MRRPFWRSDTEYLSCFLASDEITLHEDFKLEKLASEMSRSGLVCELMDDYRVLSCQLSKE